MATTPTSLPIPSEDPRDLKFNAGKFDEVMTSDAHYYTDRFGVRRWTIAGFEYTALEAIRAYGYITMDSFEDGATLTLPNQVLRYESTGEYYRWDGAFPKVVAPGSTPTTSGGVGLGAWVSVGDASLRSDLKSITGPNLIGGASYATLRAYTGGLTSIYVMGRVSQNDGGEGWFDKVSTPGLVDDDGTVLVALNGDKWLRRNLIEVSPLWFGADPTGATDSVTAINNAAAAARRTDNGRPGTLPPVLDTPAGHYQINGKVHIFDWANGTLNFDGVYFSGTASTAQEAVFQIDNASNLKVTGSLTITTNGLANYDAAFDVKASPGGLIKPDTGIVSHVDIFGVSVRESFTGFRIGRKDNDAQVAELQFHGCETIFCANGVHIEGSQSGATFNSCTLTAGLWHTFSPSTKYRILKMNGGICNIVGGEFVNSGVPNTYSNHAAIEFSPSVSAAFSNPYGILTVTGCLIEVSSYLVIVGVDSLTGPFYSSAASMTFDNCGGFVDEVPSEPFIKVFDHTFSGKISIGNGCNFYTNGTVRTGVNISSDSPTAHISCGRKSFGVGFKDWMGGCIGGVLHHDMLPIASASVLGFSLSSGSDTIIVFNATSSVNGFPRYNVYNTSNGHISSPDGCRSLRIDFNGRAGSISGTVRVRKNGVDTLGWGVVSSGSLSMTVLDHAPRPGDYYEIITVAGAVATLDGTLTLSAEI